MAKGMEKPAVLERSFSNTMETLNANDKDHGSHILKGLLAMYKDGRYSDVSLKIGNERAIRAHRAVLASFSPYFEALLGANWEEGNKDEVEIPGLDERAVSDVIEFAYSGNITINTENVQTLLEAANYLGVEFVKKSCGDFLKGGIDDKTCLSIWRLADFYALEELVKVAKQHCLRHFSNVCEEEEFLCLPFNFLSDLLAEEELCVVTEDLIPRAEEREKVVLQAVFRYIKHHEEERKAHLPKLLSSLVRLPTLSDEYLLELTTHDLLVGSCDEILEKAQTLKKDPPVKDSPDERWAIPRKFAERILKWGRAFANGRQVQPEIAQHSDKDGLENLENECCVTGMELWIRHWDGRPVLGGLKVYYGTDKTAIFGDGCGGIYNSTAQEHHEHHEFHLEENERIVKVDVNSGFMIDKLTFYTNKKDEDGNPKSYGPYGGSGGGFHSETPPGSYGYLAGVSGAVVMSQGEAGITRLQFVWRSYIFPGDDRKPQRGFCVLDVEDEDYDDYDDYYDSDDNDDFDEYDDYDDEYYDDYDDLYDQELGVQPYMFEPLA